MSSKPSSFCVFTVLTGNYESLNEQPMAGASRIPFVCLTDTPELASASWEIRQIVPNFPSDTVRSQRAAKILAHRHLPEFDASLYIDNSVVLSKPPELLIEQFDPKSGFCLLAHSFRETVLAEFIEVAQLGLDDPDRIAEQLRHYQADRPKVLEARPLWTGLILRDHRNPTVRAMSEVWLAHVMRHSRRDQLSLNMALDLTGLRPQILRLDNHVSPFHTWPHVRNRNEEKQRPWAADRRSPRAAYSAPAKNASDAPKASEKNGAAPLWRGMIGLLSTLRDHRGARRARRKLPSDPTTLKNAAPAGTPALLSFPIAPGGDDRPFARFVVSPHDDRGRALIVSGGNLNSHSLTIWRQLMSSAPWTHVLDVGANYGEMLFNAAPPPSAHVLAFEPNPEIAPYLEMNLLCAGIRASVVRRAVSDKTGTAEFLIDRKWSGYSCLAPSPRAHADSTLPRLCVPTTSLADALGGATGARGSRLLVKIEIEGGEVGALQGLMPALDDLIDFAALVEVLYLGPEERTWLAEHFTIELFDMSTGTLGPIDPCTAEQLSGLLTHEPDYSQHVVLRRKLMPRFHSS